MILFSAEAIIASSTSKFGIRIPLTDDEDFNSSTDSANSTSLIHCIASVGNCGQVHTSVLNLIFQQAKVADVGEFVKMGIWSLRSLLVCTIIHWKSSVTKDDWNSGWRSWLASLVRSFGFHSSHVVMCALIHRGPRIWLVLKWTHLDLQKRFPIYHACPKCLAAHCCGSAFPENGLAFHQDLDEVGKTQVDW